MSKNGQDGQDGQAGRAGRAPVRAQAERRTAGEVIERHSHDHHQLIYVSTGVVAIQTARGAWVASRERAVWTPAGVWHEHRVYGDSALHIVDFPTGETSLPPDTPTVLAVDPLLRELLVAYTEPGLSGGEADRVRAVLRDRLRRAPVQPLELPAARDPRLAHACRLVTEDLSRPRALSWLARETGVGQRTLSRLFHDEFGTTYPQWRTGLRVFHAMVLLADGTSVTETAHRCGWATTSAFIDTFTRTMGQTPGAYRAPAV